MNSPGTLRVRKISSSILQNKRYSTTQHMSTQRGQKRSEKQQGLIRTYFTDDESIAKEDGVAPV